MDEMSEQYWIRILLLASGGFMILGIGIALTQQKGLDVIICIITAILYIWAGFSL